MSMRSLAVTGSPARPLTLPRAASAGATAFAACGRMLLTRAPQFRPAIAPDQCVRGTVVPQLRMIAGLQFGQRRGRQRLAQFHAPLIERINVPDYALREDAVLV